MQVTKAKFVLQLEKKLICLKMFENAQPRTFFFILTHFFNLSCSRLIKFMVSKLEHAKNLPRHTLKTQPVEYKWQENKCQSAGSPC